MFAVTEARSPFC